MLKATEGPWRAVAGVEEMGRHERFEVGVYLPNVIFVTRFSRFETRYGRVEIRVWVLGEVPS